MITPIAHRGDSLHAPENTMPAFQLAYHKGATHIECDVRFTANGTPIIIHDASLSRTTLSQGLVSTCSDQQLESLDAGSWFHAQYKGTPIPKLTELLNWQRQTGITLHLEIKPLATKTLEANLDKILSIIHTLADTDKLQLLSFQQAIFKRLQQLNNTLPTALGVPRCSKQAIENAIQNNCHQINCSHRYITEKWVQNLHQAGLRVGVYTVNDRQTIDQLNAWQVDSVFTDNGNFCA